MFRHGLKQPKVILGISAAAIAIITWLVIHNAPSATEATVRRDETGSITISAMIGHFCPDSVTRPAWTRNPQVTTVRTINGGQGYILRGMQQEGVFNLQQGWTLFIGGLAVSDQSEENIVLDSWQPLPGTGRVRLNPGPSHWKLDAAWRDHSRCLSIATSIPSLGFASPLLRIVKDPTVGYGTQVACRFRANAAGDIRADCTTAPG